MFDEINLSRRRFMGAAAMTIAAAPFGTLAHARAPFGGELSALARATSWLNSQPLTAADLSGKVALVDFWTYTCINWRRQLPYVRAWAQKYKEYGLIVIGVHTPEFSFETNIDNVRWAAEDMRIPYPIAVDNEHEIWRRFKNRYWPALYFVDSKGKVVHSQFGEGEYEQSEEVIQRMLADARTSRGPNDLVAVDATGAEAAADWQELESGENYVGYARTENFASPGGAKEDKPHVYAAGQLKRNHWALSGDWTIRRESIVLNQANGRIAYRFHARDLHLVMGPVKPTAPVRFRISLDGQPLQGNHGVDADGNGNGTVMQQRMYQLIRQASPISDRQFEIEFLDPGVEAFSFTFG